MGNLNTAPLKSRQRKLQMVEELVQDAEMVQLLREILLSDGEKPAKTQAKSGALPKVAITPRGELKDAVLKILPTIPQTSFGIRIVVDALKHSGYVFQANDPFIAVGSVLKRLAKKGKVKRIQQEGNSRVVIYTR